MSMLLLSCGVRSTRNDAAGNGMADAFRQAIIEAAAVLLAILTLMFVAIRHPGVRIGLIVALDGSCKALSERQAPSPQARC